MRVVCVTAQVRSTCLTRPSCKTARWCCGRGGGTPSEWEVSAVASEERLREAIEAIDVDALSPREALDTLNALQAKARATDT